MSGVIDKSQLGASDGGIIHAIHEVLEKLVYSLAPGFECCRKATDSFQSNDDQISAVSWIYMWLRRYDCNEIR